MNTKQFKDTIRRLTAVPADARDQFIALASNLSSDEQRRVLAHLEGINADLQRNDLGLSSSLDRHSLMLQQIEQQDLS